MGNAAFNHLRRINDAFGVDDGDNIIDLSTMRPTGDVFTEGVRNAILGGAYRGGGSLADLFQALSSSGAPSGLGSSLTNGMSPAQGGLMGLFSKLRG